MIYQDDTFDYATSIARSLRHRGLNVDFSLMVKKGFGEQLKYAERRGIPVAVIAGSAEAESMTANVKVIATGDQSIESLADIPDVVARLRDK